MRQKMSPDDMDGHACLLQFDSDHAEFARGFEAGRLWSLLRAHPEEEFEEYAHGDNAEMLLRIGEATERPVQAEELGDGWLLVSYGASHLQEA